MILDSINNPKDVKKLNLIEQKQLAQELRDKIITTVSTNGGHLASNLGVVELSIAIDYVFNFPNDKIVWDVGHQCYSYKILSGRKDEFDTLRQYEGIAGFPKSDESSFDHFNTGHSSTSVSAALGMARARDINHSNEKVIAVIGDGALTGGMAFEALNDAGISKTNLLVILNDNQMSIDKNVGGLSLMLSRFRTRKMYLFVGGKGKSFVDKIPVIGKHIVRFVRKTKRVLKQIFISNMIFEDMGFRYFGPIDGHDLKQLERILEKIKDLDGPVLLHVKTVKGKGYGPAEQNPDKFHATGKFDIDTGNKEKSCSKDYSKAFGESLVKIAEKNEKIVAITAAMKDGTGLNEFADKYPDRFFDVGIAEQHAITMAAGMAKSSLIPVVPIYASFLQRAYDQLLHDVAMQNLHVVICADRAGIVGADGETHQGLFDMAFVNTIPNFTIMAPKNFEELDLMLKFAVDKVQGPVLIRYPRGCEQLEDIETEDIKLGKAEVLCEGQDFTIVTMGKMVKRCYEIAQELKEQDIDVTVINARFLKPLDSDTILKYTQDVQKIITVEDASINNGLSQTVELLLNDKSNFKAFSYPCAFIKQGDYDSIDELYKMRKSDIKQYILDNYEPKTKKRKSKKKSKNTEETGLAVIKPKKNGILNKIKDGLGKIRNKLKKKST